MKPAKKQAKKIRKATKAVTLLTRIEALLSDVLVECSEIEKSVEKNVRALLRTAEKSIETAKDYFVTPAPAKVAHKPVRHVKHAAPKTRAKAKAPAAAKKRVVRHRAPVAVAKPPEVIAPRILTPPFPPDAPPMIVAH